MLPHLEAIVQGKAHSRGYCTPDDDVLQQCGVGSHIRQGLGLGCNERCIKTTINVVPAALWGVYACDHTVGRCAARHEFVVAETRCCLCMGELASRYASYVWTTMVCSR